MFRNIALLTHFLRQRFFYYSVEVPSKNSKKFNLWGKICNSVKSSLKGTKAYKNFSVKKIAKIQGLVSTSLQKTVNVTFCDFLKISMEVPLEVKPLNVTFCDFLKISMEVPLEVQKS